MLNSKTKRELKIDQRQILIDSIEIGIPSTQQILTWGERMLPNGKKVGIVKNSKTVNYKRFTPFRDGLFCERIFGPVTSFVCACGKKQPHNKVTFCEKCEVEYIDQRSRRYRLGYISLLSPVTHIWYLKGRPSYLSLFLGKRKKTIVALAYCNAYLIEHGISKRDNNLQISDTFLSMRSPSNTKNFLQEVEKKPFHLASYSCNTFGLKGVRGSNSVKISSSGLNKKKGNIKNLISKNKKRFNRKFFATFLTHDIKKKEFSLSTSYGTPFYARQHTLPFLPTFISHFYLRDVLLNFTYSSPDYNDIPLVEYCSTKRREPLRDVHKFMAHKAVEYDLSNFTLFSKKDLYKKESVFKGLRAYKIGLNKLKTGLKVSSFFSTPSFLEKGSNNGSDLKKEHNSKVLLLKKKEKGPSLIKAKKGHEESWKLRFLKKLLQKGAQKKLFLPNLLTSTKFLPKRSLVLVRRFAYKATLCKPLPRPYPVEKTPTPYGLFCVAKGSPPLLAFPCPCPVGARASRGKTPFRGLGRPFLPLLARAPSSPYGGRQGHGTEGRKSSICKRFPGALANRRFACANPCGCPSPTGNPCPNPLKGVRARRGLRMQIFDLQAHRARGDGKGHSGIPQDRRKRGSKNKTSEASLLRKNAASGVLLRSKASKFCVAKSLAKPTEEPKQRFSDNVPSTIETKSGKGTSLSGLELTAIREILSYTGGGALQQLLQQFDQHDLCKFLFAEAQILRVLYEMHLANFTNVLVNENQQYTCVANKKSIIQHSLVVPAYSSFLVQIKRFATFLTPKKLTFSSKRLYGKKVPGRAYHQSTNHKNLPKFSKLRSEALELQGSKQKDFIKSFFNLEKKGGRLVRGQRIVRGNFVSSSQVTFVPGMKKSTVPLQIEDLRLLPFPCPCRPLRGSPCPVGARARARASRGTRLQIEDLHAQPHAHANRRFASATRRGRGRGLTKRSFVRAQPVQISLQSSALYLQRSKTLDLPFTRTSLQDQILGNLVTKRSFVSQIYDKKSCKVLSTSSIPFPFSAPTCPCPFFPLRGTARARQVGGRACKYKASLCTCKRTANFLTKRSFVLATQSGFRVPENPRSLASTEEGEASRGTSAKVIRNQLENNFGAKGLRSKKEKKIYLTPDELQSKVNDLRKKQIIRISKRIYKMARRLKVTQLLTRNHRRPEWMILSHLPVLPPDLRPILQMSEKVIVASDLNIMYQRVIYRNNRHLRVRFIDFHLVTAIQRLVQDAVDRLIENGKGGSKPYYTQSGRPLKSLSDILKGKKGRFRLNLLGKRVDFSGRSVIVVSPSCKIHECGLPKDIALELYHYFLLRQLIVKKYCASIVTAKKMIKSKSSLMWDILRELMYHHPVLLNRAPTLHRLGIQAFQPKLVFGNAILLHPLVCSGFNADFDGDQMGVHLPLSFAARAESWDLLWSRNNLLSPATGQPMLVPSQDMVLGFYYITAPPLQSLSSNSNSNISGNYLNAPTTPNLIKGVCKPNAPPVPCALASTKLRFVRRFACATPVPFLPVPVPVPLRGKGFPVGDGKGTEGLREAHGEGGTNGVGKRRQLKTKFNKESKNLYKKNKRFLFLNTQEITTTFQKGDIKLHTPVWLHWNGKIENEDISQIPLELRVDSFGKQQSVYEKYIYSNFFTKDRNVNEDILSNFSVGFATAPKEQSFGASFRSSKAPLLRKAQEEKRQLPYNQPYNSFSFTKVYKPFSFIGTRPQVYYVRTTAGRILMNNLLDIKKSEAF